MSSKIACQIAIYENWKLADPIAFAHSLHSFSQIHSSSNSFIATPFILATEQFPAQIVHCPQHFQISPCKSFVLKMKNNSSMLFLLKKRFYTQEIGPSVARHVAKKLLYISQSSYDNYSEKRFLARIATLDQLLYLKNNSVSYTWTWYSNSHRNFHVRKITSFFLTPDLIFHSSKGALWKLQKY